MRWIPTRVHGALDYLWGALLLAAPWLLGFARGGAETWTAIVFGIGAIVYSLLTDYELGVARVLSMRGHLLLDLLGGALLAASPWLFGFADRVRLPHVAFGLFSIAASLMTRIRREHQALARA
jgi:SPW repeat